MQIPGKVPHSNNLHLYHRSLHQIFKTEKTDPNSFCLNASLTSRQKS